MSPGPDLFVVCKQCGSEVSPYITECPYCGSRLRRRAPKLPRVKSRGGLLRRLGRTFTFQRARSRAHPGGRSSSRRQGLSARGIAAVRDDRAGGAGLRRLGARARGLPGHGPRRGPRRHLGHLCQLLQDRHRRSPARRLVEAAEQPVRLPQRSVCVHRPARDRDLRMAARAPPGTGDRARGVLRRERHRRARGARAVLGADRQRRQRGRAGADRGLVDPRPAGGGRRALLRGRPARHRQRSRRCCSCCLTPARRRAGWRASWGRSSVRSPVWAWIWSIRTSPDATG